MIINFLFFIQTLVLGKLSRYVYQLLLQHVRYITDTDVIYI